MAPINEFFSARIQSDLVAGFAVSVLSFSISSTVHAQSESEGAAFDFLEEVVVSAERRETSLQETALAITAYNQRVLELKGVQDVEDLATSVPGFSVGGDVEGGDVRPLFMIRGIGQTGGRDTLERGVGLYVDDVYLPRTTGSYLQLLDVERVEVLKGPQGTLFGRNSTGGAVRYITRKPSSEFEGSVSGTFGSYNRVDVSGLINVPLTDNLFLRTQVGSFRRDGYLEAENGNNNDRGDQNDVAVRTALRFQPSADLTLDASISYARSETFGPANRPVHFQPNSLYGIGFNGYFESIGQDPLVEDDPRIVSSDFHSWHGRCFVGRNTVGLSVDNGQTFFGNRDGYCNLGVVTENTIATFEAGWNVSESLSFKSITGYVDGESNISNDWGVNGAYNSNEVSDYDSFSQEFQLAYSDDRLNVVGGLYYFSESPVMFNHNGALIFFSVPPLGIAPGDCCSAFERTREQDTESFGVFGQLTYDLTSSLSLTLGARYTEDEKDITVTRTNRPAAAPGTPFSASDSWSSTNYRATLQYQATDDVMVYGTVASGFKAGGFNDGVASGPQLNGGVVPFQPEDVTNYELGLRSEFFDGALLLNLTTFYTEYEQLQLTVPIFNGDEVSLAIQNAGAVDLWGGEVDSRLRVSDNLSFEVSVATLDYEYQELLPGSALLIPSTCSDPSNPTLDTCDAQDMARAPELQYTLGAVYISEFASGSTLVFSTGYSWTDELESSSSSANSYRTDSYGTLNLRAEYSPADANWSIALAGTNVTDKEYETTGFSASRFFATDAATAGRPAEWSLQLKAEF